jgi:hypothetical protein
MRLDALDRLFEKTPNDSVGPVRVPIPCGQRLNAYRTARGYFFYLYDAPWANRVEMWRELDPITAQAVLNYLATLPAEETPHFIQTHSSHRPDGPPTGSITPEVILHADHH